MSYLTLLSKNGKSTRRRVNFHPFSEFNPSFRQDQPNGQIEEIENKMSDDEIEIDTELPCKIEPTESADLANNISKVNFSYFF